jgi:transcriptional regulator with XRE-family HTH domain
MTTTLPPSLKRLMPLFRELDNDLLPVHAERRRIRTAAGWSQARLGRHIGGAQRNVANWEGAGAPEPTPAYRLLYRLALKQLEQVALERALVEAYELERSLERAQVSK